MSAWLTAPLTSESDCAWLPSGAASASTCPVLTTSPSRTLSPCTRPETADLTSTLISGSTTPTSRTLTWRSSVCTLPRRNGDSFVSGLERVVARATTRLPARRTTAEPAITHFLFLRMRNPSLTSCSRSCCNEIGSRWATLRRLPLWSLYERGGKKVTGDCQHPEPVTSPTTKIHPNG